MFFGYSTDYVASKIPHKNKKINATELLRIIKGKPSTAFLAVQKMIDDNGHGDRYDKEFYKSEAYDKAKKKQSFFQFGGYCKTGHNKSDTEPNGFLQVDFDFKFDKGNHFAINLRRILEDSGLFCFAVISPSRFGVKGLIRTDIDDMRNYETKKIQQAVETKISRYLQEYFDKHAIEKCKVDSLAFSQVCFVPFYKDFKPNFNAFFKVKSLLDAILEADKEEETRRRKKALSKTTHIRKPSLDKLESFGVRWAYEYAKNVGSGFGGTHQAHLSYTATCYCFGISEGVAWDYLCERFGYASVGIDRKEFTRLYDNNDSKRWRSGITDLEIQYREDLAKKREYAKSRNLRK